MTHTILAAALALTLGLPLSSAAQTTSFGSAVPAGIARQAAEQFQRLEQKQPSEPKPVGTTGVKATTPSKPQVRPAAPTGEALVLLQRIEELLKRSTSDDGGLKAAGVVKLNRADVDEILALSQQLRLMLEK